MRAPPPQPHTVDSMLDYEKRRCWGRPCQMTPTVISKLLLDVRRTCLDLDTNLTTNTRRRA